MDAIENVKHFKFSKHICEFGKIFESKSLINLMIINYDRNAENLIAKWKENQVIL